MVKIQRLDNTPDSGLSQPNSAIGAPLIPPTRRTKARTVLFLDDEGWSSFEQVARGLRRRGVRTVRVTSVPPPRLQRLINEPHFAWLADRLFYDERIHLGSAQGPSRLRDLLDSGEVFDVVANEPALLTIGFETPLGKALIARSLAFCKTPPATLLDKFAVNVALQRAGLNVPRQLRACDVTPAEAARRLGLPLILKHPTGASGDLVRIVRDPAQIKTYMHELGGDEARLLYQEQIPGRVVIYAAVIGPAGVVLEHGFRVERSQYENGPSAEVTLHDTPELLAAGRLVSAQFGPQGFASFGFIETADGRLLHIDANIRPWGMIAAPLGLGIDFIEAYAAMVLDAPPEARPTNKPSTAPLPVFPHALFVSARTCRAREGMNAAAAFLRTCAGRLGLSYCGYILARTLVLAVRELGADRRARRREARAVAATSAPGMLAPIPDEAGV